ncbi:MAG: hypothetical protein BWZ02_00548 [Lentisphaerae bacterium ADurb.BinA184]|nr:MAG: hypothetical protein BWZ02_00548 [Lentisphaerae bacterium ADurb.BinA184]
MSAWDIALVAAVSVMGTALAYLRSPQHKAFVLMLPVPFTLATLALGRPVDATNVLAMGALFGYTIGVWFLHVRRRWPIVAAIVVCALAYCVAGAGIARVCPAGDAVFWGAVILVFIAGLALVRALPYRAEPSHRTPLPVWVKLPAIALVIAGLVAVKQQLGGFTTMFPMVGVVAAYEARHSLWTIVRRIPWILVIMAPVMGLIRLTQGRLGLPSALALGWLLVLLQLWRLRLYYAGQAAHATENAVRCRHDPSDPSDLSDLSDLSDPCRAPHRADPAEP